MSFCGTVKQRSQAQLCYIRFQCDTKDDLHEHYFTSSCTFVPCGFRKIRYRFCRKKNPCIPSRCLLAKSLFLRLVRLVFCKRVLHTYVRQNAARGRLAEYWIVKLLHTQQNICSLPFFHSRAPRWNIYSKDKQLLNMMYTVYFKFTYNCLQNVWG